MILAQNTLVTCNPFKILSNIHHAIIKLIYEKYARVKSQNLSEHLVARVTLSSITLTCIRGVFASAEGG